MNIIELCLSPGLGGLELYVFRCSEALTQHSNNRNDVHAVLSENSKLDSHFKKNSRINTQYLSPLFSLFPVSNARKLAAIIDDQKIDVVHMHWGKDLPLATMAKIFSRKKPALVYTRQMMITRKKNDILHRLQYRQIDLLLTITQELEILCKRYITIARDNIKTLYYGVNAPEHVLSDDAIDQLRQKKGITPDEFVAGLFGRLEDGKGQHLLIKAVARAKAEGRHIKALIVGHEMINGYRAILEKLATDLDVTENIIFNDFVNSPQTLMQICDCVCLTSYEETFGLVLPEAMRAGVAVIGSNKGGVPEIIEDKVSGLLFEPKDDNSLYQQLRFLYDNPDLKQEIAANGKSKADNKFNNEKHFSRLEALFIEEASR